MDATTRGPGSTASGTAAGRLGGHIHRLLALAAALADAAANAAGVDAAGSGAVGSDVGAGSGDTDAFASVADAMGSDVGPGGCGVPFGVELGVLTDAQAVAWAQELERLGRFLAGLQVQAAGELAGRTRAGRFSEAGITHPAGVLTGSLLLSGAEANRRLRLAEALLP
ncbi:hypothetical protein, partial [Specibacter sp. RAF43]|uniref:hypothetical protein n=1 Tax=Specibacter sp. RAF43 TaxID=3233057 RepID=UPI003F9D5B29